MVVTLHHGDFQKIFCIFHLIAAIGKNQEIYKDLLL